MINNSVKARIQLKKDTEAHWNLARNFIPLAGEPIIYVADETHISPRVKVGDGVTYVTDLPFIAAECNENRFVKSNTTAYWNSQRDYVPEQNTIVVYTDKGKIEKDGEEVNVAGIKIGDGSAYCIDLPFVGDELLTMLEDHINDNDRHVSLQEKTFWNSKLNYDDGLIEENENLIFTRN